MNVLRKLRTIDDIGNWLDLLALSGHCIYNAVQIRFDSVNELVMTGDVS